MLFFDLGSQVDSKWACSKALRRASQLQTFARLCAANNAHPTSCYPSKEGVCRPRFSFGECLFDRDVDLPLPCSLYHPACSGPPRAFFFAGGLLPWCTYRQCRNVCSQWFDMHNLVRVVVQSLPACPLTGSVGRTSETGCQPNSANHRMNLLLMDNVLKVRGLMR